jgi:L(+)-tartrate dehydratase beta subunit
MAHYDFTMPVTEAQVRALVVDDTVTLNRDALRHSRRDADRDVRPRPHDALRPRGHAVVHTAPNVKRVERSAGNPAGYAPICVGTTTSSRMERFTRPLMELCGVRIVIGKGGLGAESTAAFRELGGVYLALIGGAAALETTWVEAIEDVDLDDLNPESLWKFRVAASGRCVSRWTATARACTPPSMPKLARSARRRWPRSASAGDKRRARRRPVNNAARARISTLRTDVLILGAGGAGLFAALHAQRCRPGARHHDRRQRAARQVRLHAHGAGRLQRGARARRLDRAALHGHDRRREVAAGSGSRLDARDRRHRAHPRARERARLLFRPQPGRDDSPESLSPGRRSTAPCTRAT